MILVDAMQGFRPAPRHSHVHLHCLVCLLLAACCKAQPVNTTTIKSQLEECVAKSVSSLQRVSCSNASSQPLAEILASFSAECLGITYSSTKPIKVLVPRDAPPLKTWRSRAKQFQDSTGIQVVVDTTLSSFGVLEMASELYSKPEHDAFIFSPSTFGLAVGNGGLTDLAPFISASPTLNYGDYIKYYAEESSAYRNQTVLLHLQGELLLLYYRLDLFKQYNLSVPETWDEFLSLARTMNGTDTDGDGQPDLLGACFDVADNCKGGFLLPTVAGAYIQYEGPPQGFWFDPETAPNLQPLANNVGMEAALKFWQDLTPYTNATKTCNVANADFQAGRCLMTINWGDEFKAIRRSSIAKPGMFGVSVLPGSTRVLDRGTNTLVQCDMQRCPYAVPKGTVIQPVVKPVSREQAPIQAMLNFAPYLDSKGWLAGVSSRTSVSQQRAAFRFLASLVAPEASWQDVLDPTSTIDPYRESHLRDLDRWVAAGYDRQVTELYLACIRIQMLTVNKVMDIRLAYDMTTAGYRAPYETAFQNVTKAGAGPDSIKRVAQAVQSTIESSFQRMVTQLGLYLHRDPSSLSQQYWDIIGRRGSVLDLINSRLPRPPPPPPPPSPTARSTSQTELTVGVTTPLVALTLVLVTAALFYMRNLRKQQHRSLLGKVLAPGVGPNTTLVITDVEDSTTLFEVLPVSCMDKCMQFICGVIRDGIYKHSGYESATEGDSFIIAFHSASAAVSFCVELQDGLLQVAWPPELFQAEGCDSVHPVWVSSTGDIAQHCKEMLVGNVGPASKGKVRSATQSCLRRIQHQLHIKRDKPHIIPETEDAVADNVISQLLLQHSDATEDRLLDAGAGNEDGDVASVDDSWWLSANPSRQGSDHGPARESDRKHTIRDSAPSQRGSKPGLPLDCGPEHSRSSVAAPPDLLARSKGYPSVKLWQLMAWAFTLDQAGQGTTDGSQKALLVFQGPRIRCAVHSGLTSSQDMQYNKAAGRMHYSGNFLEVAKSVESCAHGGQILMSQETFSLLDRTQLPEQVMLLHMGEFLIGGKKLSAPSVARDSLPEARASRPSHFSSREEKWHEGTQLYTVLSAQAAPRLVLLKYPKVKQTLANGLLDAPVGTVTIGFMQIVGMPDIKAWNAKEASSVLSMYADIVKGQLQQAGGYLVEHVDGFALVAFTDGLSALRWAIDVRQDMLNAPWSQQLLRYGLTEEVSITQVDPDGQQQRVVLLRGPRVKAGFDTGMTKSQVHATTGRMAYRGKVMNRAARIQAVATSAQVLCSAETWAQVLTKSANPNDLGLFKMPVGTVPLKGIKDKVTIYQVNTGVNTSKSGGGRARKSSFLSRVISKRQADPRIPSQQAP